MAVVSDLHFCNARAEGHGSELSHVVIEKLHESPGKNPWTDLMEMVAQENIRADFLLCPGDITTHAERAPLVAAWKGLVQLGKALQSSMMACATGNHDVRSRVPGKEGTYDPVHDLDNPHDLFENLKLLSPEYPLHVYTDGINSLPNRKRRTEYFGTDFVLHEDIHARVIVFNSCARHLNDKSVYERGLIAESTLSELREQLNTLPADKINIFLCHHHPIQHTQGGTGAYDFIFRGEELVKCLQAHGDWIIVHGHKHEGRIVYASGGSPASAPVVFSASSLGAIFTQAQINKYRNQFYILEIELGAKGCSRGTAHIWNWYTGTGWAKSIDSRIGLIDGNGFGERAHPDDLAEKVAQMVGLESMKWDSVRHALPFLVNLTPEGQDDLEKSLKRKHNLIFLRNQITHSIMHIGPGA